ERPLARVGGLDQVSVVVGLAALAIVAELLAADTAKVLLSGVLGMVVYLLVKALGEIFESGGNEEAAEVAGGSDEALGASATAGRSGSAAPGFRGGVIKASGKTAFFLFLYLEVLDASFSFDGVVGAFAISQNIFVIAVGLGIGAMYIRSLTVYLVRQGTLDEYVYLEHGAHWAIGALAIILLLSVRYEIPEVITGLIGVGFIGAALLSSIVRKRARSGEAEPDEDKAESAGARR
ncbi:MAG TPA: DUF475 domain-containing protein, partial [Nitrococcus sp.]|nr:DUF475 domain-containing protein [Nitrococcus sp.]